MHEQGTLNQWLQSLTGRKNAALGADRTYRLLLGRKLPITLFVPDEGSRLIIMADLLRVDTLSLDILREVAAINLRFDLTGGMTVALEKSSSMVIAFYQCALGPLDFDSFQSILAKLETNIRKIEETLRTLIQDPHAFIPAQVFNPAYGNLV